MRANRLVPLAALLGLLMALGLTACSRNEKSPPATQNNPPAAEQPKAEQPASQPPADVAQQEPEPATTPPEPPQKLPVAPVEEKKPAARPKPKPPEEAKPKEPEAPPAPAEVTVAAGAEIEAALQAELTSHESKAGDTFALEVTEPVRIDGYLAIPKGARVTGQVVGAKASGSVKGRGEITLSFTSVTDAKGDAHPIQAETFFAKAEGASDRDAAMIAGGAAGGAIIGGLLGGKKGAAIGGLVGAAAGTGTVLATKGPEVKLADGQVFKIKLTGPLAVPPGPKQ